MSRGKAWLCKRIRELGFKKGDFVLTSGKRSNYYIDVKKAYARPEVLTEIAVEMSRFIEREERVAGMELGAVPIAVAVGLESQLPFTIIRKDARTHGTRDRIEGEIKPGEHVLLVEDVATTGGSILSARKAIVDAGGECNRAVVVVDRLEGAGEMLADHGIELISLLTVKDLEGEQ